MTDWQSFLSEIGVTQEGMNLAESIPFRLMTLGESKTLELRPSVIDRTGIFAKKDIRAGRIVCHLKRNGLWTAPGRFVNHSSKNNIVYRNNQYIALRDIPAGAEIVADYRQVRRVMMGERVTGRKS